jgi:hypothetical protein
MCCLDIPVSIKEQLIKYMRHYLWRKKNGEVQSNGPALVSWDKICRPKNQGGLGVLNLSVQNNALLIKNLQKKIQQEGHSLGEHDLGFLLWQWSSV